MVLGPAPAIPAAPYVDPSGPTGSYTLTVTTSPSCETATDAGTTQVLPFPDSLRVRRYDAEFAKGTAVLRATDGTGNQIQIGGTSPYLHPGRSLMTMHGADLTIVVEPEDGLDNRGLSTCDIEGYSWYEKLDAGKKFVLCGTWRGSAENPARIEGTITGTIEYFDNSSHLICHATDHRFTLNLVQPSSAR